MVYGQEDRRNRANVAKYILAMGSVHTINLIMLIVAWYLTVNYSVQVGMPGAILVAMPAIYSVMLIITGFYKKEKGSGKALIFAALVLLSAVINLIISLMISWSIQGYFNNMKA